MKIILLKIFYFSLYLYKKTLFTYKSIKAVFSHCGDNTDIILRCWSFLKTWNAIGSLRFSDAGVS